MGDIREKATDHCLAFVRTHRNFKTIHLKYAEISDEVNRLMALSQNGDRPLDSQKHAIQKTMSIRCKQRMLIVLYGTGKPESALPSAV